TPFLSRLGLAAGSAPFGWWRRRLGRGGRARPTSTCACPRGSHRERRRPGPPCRRSFSTASCNDEWPDASAHLTNPPRPLHPGADRAPAVPATRPQWISDRDVIVPAGLQEFSWSWP